ncbi:uncharacterized protein LOC108607778 [Drosophila busckii]|nr:uncharacterized protein LOC108607778 [Drosophila busckii]
MSKRNRHIYFGIWAMILVIVGLEPGLSDYDKSKLPDMVRVMQVTATVALLFGLLKKSALHKEKFVMYWMVISAISGIVLISTWLQKWREVHHYSFSYLQMHYRLVIVSFSLLLYLIYRIYNDYFENEEQEEPQAEKLPAKQSEQVA